MLLVKYTHMGIKAHSKGAVALHVSVWIETINNNKREAYANYIKTSRAVF